MTFWRVLAVGGQQLSGELSEPGFTGLYGLWDDGISGWFYRKCLGIQDISGGETE